MEIQNNKISIINDIDYKKLNNDCKAKHTETKKAIEEGLNLLISLRNVNINQIEIELKKSVDKLLFPIQIASNQKIKRIFVSCLDVIKKLISYNLLTQRHSNNIIKFFQLNEELVNIVFNMCLKFYAMKNQSFKNPLNSVLTQLVKTIFGFLDATLRPSIMKKKRKLLEEKKNEKK